MPHARNERYPLPRSNSLINHIAYPSTLAVNAAAQGGIAQYPNNAHLTLLHANFLIECAHNYGAGTSLLRAARKMDPGRVEKYVIYLREQEHVLMVHNNSASETTLDLVSYVEFQRNFRCGGRMLRWWFDMLLRAAHCCSRPPVGKHNANPGQRRMVWLFFGPCMHVHCYAFAHYSCAC